MAGPLRWAYAFTCPSRESARTISSILLHVPDCAIVKARAIVSAGMLICLLAQRMNSLPNPFHCGFAAKLCCAKFGFAVRQVSDTEREMGRSVAKNPAHCIVDARHRWDNDCADLQDELSDLGLGFGVNGYRLALERGAHRLEEGVRQALQAVDRAAGSVRDDWDEAHWAINRAIEVEFQRSSTLLSALEVDPILQKVLARAYERVVQHHAGGRKASGLRKVIGRLGRSLSRR